MKYLVLNTISSLEAYFRLSQTPTKDFLYNRDVWQNCQYFPPAFL